MPVYGRYEPAEAMRDLGLSLGKIVTDMAETELQSRKMDLALKESDLKLGMLEKEAQIGTLKTQLEGEARKTQLAQEEEKMGMAKEAQSFSQGMQLKNFGLAEQANRRAASAEARAQKQFEIENRPIKWGAVADKAGPLAEVFRAALGKDMIDKETTMKEAAPVMEVLFRLFPGTVLDVTIANAQEKMDGLNKEIKQLEPMARTGDEGAIEKLNTKLEEYQKLAASANNMVNMQRTDKASIAETIKKLGDMPQYQDKTYDELLAMATQAHTAMRDLKRVQVPADIEDVFYQFGIKKDPNPVTEKDIKGAFDGEKGIMKLPKNKREEGFATILAGVDADRTLSTRKKQIMKEMLTTEWEARKAGKPKTEKPKVEPKPEPEREEPAKKFQFNLGQVIEQPQGPVVPLGELFGKPPESEDVEEYARRRGMMR